MTSERTFGNRLLVLQAGVAALVLASFALALVVVGNDRNIVDSEEGRYRSYLLADELRQSSDDLTRMVRTYAATGDARYKEYFQDILDIRDGRAPRPVRSHNVYWDAVTATGEAPRESGAPAALGTLMQQAGFTDAEIALLKESEDRSNALVAMEVEAMNAVAGLYKDPSGAYTVRGAPDRDLARDLLHGAAYHEAKGRIMRPLERFIDVLEERTANEVAGYRARGRSLIAALSVTIALSFLLAAVSIVLVFRRTRRRDAAG